MIIPAEVLKGNDYGILSAKLRFESCQNATNAVSALTFDVDELLQDLTPEVKETARPLLFTILEAIRDQRAPDFRWVEGNPEKKLEQIHTVFALCDYLCLNQFQENYLRKEMAIAAVAQDGQALRYASDDLKADKEVVLTAVAQDGLALDYASDELKADKEVVLTAVAQAGCALHYASDELKGDPEVLNNAARSAKWLPLRGYRSK